MRTYVRTSESVDFQLHRQAAKAHSLIHTYTTLYLSIESQVETSGNQKVRYGTVRTLNNTQRLSHLRRSSTPSYSVIWRFYFLKISINIIIQKIILFSKHQLYFDNY